MKDLFADIGIPSIAPLGNVALELRGIHQSYNSGKTVVFNDLNIAIQESPSRGRIIALLGPSGCGKSTILRYIAGLQQPSSGQVLLHGEPVADHHLVGMVFQRYSSLPWLSVIDNITLGLKYQGVKERIARGTEMLNFVGLNGHEEKFAQYPTLSGGQLQRVAIARSLLANPKILLMDEPFGALDIKTRLKMQDFVLQVAAGLPGSVILTVTHDISEAVYVSDEILILGGSPSELKKRVTVPFANRTPDLKRDAAFQRMVSELEEFMMG